MCTGMVLCWCNNRVALTFRPDALIVWNARKRSETNDDTNAPG
jgi:hypothetical protein